MMRIPQRFYYFDTAAFKEPEDKAEERQDTGEFQDKNIYCAICGHVITSVGARFKMNGSCEHTFTNPHGYVYTITCFKNAPGTKNAGEETEEYTWFPGYAWSYALCGQCTSHLGWVFAKQRADIFYGLISERISGKKSGS
jgi:uncharacterized CHY-type Zn-finger protein